MRIIHRLRKVPKPAGTLALSALCSLSLVFSSSASWQNEAAGPGAAVWVEEAAPDGSAAAPPAPLAGGGPEIPAGASVTYVDGKAVSITNPDGSRTMLSADGTPLTESGTHTDGNAARGQDGADSAASAQDTETPTQDASGTSEAGTDANTDTAAQTPSASDPNLVASGGREIDLRKPMIALTYDDGPLSSVGNRIMDLAEQANGRVTFFMVGERVKSHADEVRRMTANGHEPANHTYSHKYLNKLSAAEIRAQVQSCSDVIEEVSGVRPALMRLPGGNRNQTVLQNVDMPIVLWNIDTRDWATRNVQSTVDAVLGKVKDGDIVLMHELYSQTADASAVLIPALSAEGYQLVTVSELARFKGKTLLPNQIYYSIR